MNCQVTVCNDILLIWLLLEGGERRKSSYFHWAVLTIPQTMSFLEWVHPISVHFYILFTLTTLKSRRETGPSGMITEDTLFSYLFSLSPVTISDVKLMWPRFLFVSKVVDDTNVEICPLQVVPERDLFSFQST